ncbi:hypothetical protein [Paenibacillus sp. YYML68]|uniref:hypothetical protein n=1 Tax=Paenibacillus sp. YYML68 TaxID=2909250 RepID=UPI00249376A2|nr:hypothetical protein [Paenibacillus sp. YYML68]
MTAPSSMSMAPDIGAAPASEATLQQHAESHTMDALDVDVEELTDPAVIQQALSAPLQASLDTANSQVKVYLAMLHATQEVQEEASCLAQSGDTVVHGERQLVYAYQGKAYRLKLQDQYYTYNTQRNPLEKLSIDKTELLTLKQYASCNGSTYELFALDPTQEKLVRLNWLEGGRTKQELFAHTLEVKDEQLLSQAYDNSIGKTITILWNIDVANKAVEATSIVKE